MTAREHVLLELEGLGDRELEYVASIAASLRARPSAAPVPSFDPAVYGEPRKPYLEVLADIRRRQRARGHQPRSREEVDAYLISERNSWD